MSKPSILLVPGAFAQPEWYDNIVNEVSAQGFPMRAIKTVSVGPGPGLSGSSPPPTMYDDAAVITEQISKLVNEGKDVILVAHSYGGVPMTEAAKGLGKAEREKQGKKGGILKLAYMTCIVPEIGVSAGAFMGEVPPERKIPFKLHDNGWLSHEDLERSAAIVFSDVSKEDGLAWMKKYPQHSGKSYVGELTHPGYKDFPVSYLVCEEDQCIPSGLQRQGIEMIERVSGRKVDVTSIDAGHVPSLSQPEKVVDWIVNTAIKV